MAPFQQLYDLVERSPNRSTELARVDTRSDLLKTTQKRGPRIGQEPAFPKVSKMSTVSIAIGERENPNTAREFGYRFCDAWSGGYILRGDGGTPCREKLGATYRPLQETG